MQTARKVTEQILIALYRYNLLTPQQLAILLNYKLSYIYATISDISAEDPELLSTIKIPYLNKNRVAYYNKVKGAYIAAQLTKEEDIFNPKNFENPPTQIRHIISNNDFYTQLIKHSKEKEGEGLIEWLGGRDAGDRYATFRDDTGKRKTDLRPDGFGVYVLPNAGRLFIHTELDTGTETISRLEDKMRNYVRHLQPFWGENIEKANILFLTLVKSRVNRVMENWEFLRNGPLAQQRLPSVWAAWQQDLEKVGPLELLWKGAGDTCLKLNEMPLMPIGSYGLEEILGKQEHESCPWLYNKKVKNDLDNVIEENLDDKQQSQTIKPTQDQAEEKITSPGEVVFWGQKE